MRGILRLYPPPSMILPIRMISTDFDGTLHADFEVPPVPHGLQALLGALQTRGVTWIINTGRDLSSLMESLGRAQLSVWPDYVVTVEREIHRRDGHHYIGLEEWNHGCTLAHTELFARIQPDLPRLVDWVNNNFEATLYEDVWSPFCMIAKSQGEAEMIHNYLDEYCRTIPNLVVVRNDVYARFSHLAYNKGSALAEIARHLGVGPEGIVTAGDHLNDLPMLSSEYARWLIAPSNAIDAVKEAVRRQDGFVSEEACGHGVLRGLERILERTAPPPGNGDGTLG
jgi:hydroxymethylpyrimidine pyrophosphatase-like HAD family hydrolase